MTTLATELWTGSNGAAWPAQWTTAVTGTSAFTIQGNAGQLTCEPGWSYAEAGRAYLTGLNVYDVDITVTVTYSTIAECYTRIGRRGASGGAGYGVGLAHRPTHEPDRPSRLGLGRLAHRIELGVLRRVHPRLTPVRSYVDG